jgi:multiple sugar transport system substrate-binding protein
VGKEELAKFTDRTGISVQAEILPFDQVHDKEVTAMSVGTAPADAMEVDSLWVGQYAAANWLTPVTDLMPPATIADANAKDPFTVKGQLLGLPYAVDYRWTIVNMTLLNKAGITAPPQSWTDIETDAKALVDKGVVKYPISIPLNISAEATEPWLTALVSAGGTLLDASGQPAFATPGSPGFQAADFLHRIYTEKLVDPGAVNITGQQSEEAFAGGTAAFILRGGPSSFGSYANPQTSKVSKDTIAGYLVGPTGPGAGVFGLPESVGVPAASTNKCAAAMFLAWWAETPQEVWRYTGPNGSIFPAQGEAAKQVLAGGDPAQAKQVEDVLPNIKPLFPEGAPTWYPQFANDAATVLQAITIGDTPVQDGLNTLADQTKALISK